MNRAQALASLQAYFPDDKEIVTIIKLCDLYPGEGFGGWRKWKNNYSPYILVQKNKKIVTRWKDQNWFVKDNDLYAFANVYDIAKISNKLLFISNDFDESNKESLCFLFWGVDDRLRYRRFANGNWHYDPPLTLPINDIRSLVQNEFVDGHMKIQLTKKSNKRNIQGWVTEWPPKKEFYQEVLRNAELWNNQIKDLLT